MPDGDALDALDDDEGGDDGRSLIRKLWALSAGLELIYIGWVLWEQLPEWKREHAKARGRAMAKRLISPCTNCRERRRAANETVFEAMQIVEGAGQ